MCCAVRICCPRRRGRSPCTGRCMPWGWPPICRPSRTCYVMGEGSKKLSKRDPESNLFLHRERGFIPEGLLNYLALLGWSLSADEDVFTVDELVENFDVADVLGNPARFDVKKAEAINGTHIRRLEAQDFRDRLVPYLQQLGLVGEELTPRQAALLDGAAPLVQERIALLAEGADMMAFLFVDDEAWRSIPRRSAAWGRRRSCSRPWTPPRRFWRGSTTPAGPRRTSRRGCARRSSRAGAQAAQGLRCGALRGLREEGLPAAVRVHGAAGPRFLAGTAGPFPC